MTHYSIIIPHYDIPHLLIRCLRSIPVRPDIQVIVVDDCSPGASRYSQQYPELTRPYLEYYSTSVGGSAGRARNVGLDHARGKWVICLDADDLLTPDAEALLDEVFDRPEDLLILQTRSVMNDDLTQPGTRSVYQEYFDQYQADGSDAPFRYQHYPLWAKIIRRELIEAHSIRCSPTRYSNDVLLSLQSGIHASRLAIIPRELVLLTQRDDSLAASFHCQTRPSIAEYRDRADVAYQAASLLRRHHIDYPLEEYVNFSTAYCCDYPLSFLLYLFRQLFRHPRLVLRVVGVIIGKGYRRVF